MTFPSSAAVAIAVPSGAKAAAVMGAEWSDRLRRPTVTLEESRGPLPYSPRT